MTKLKFKCFRLLSSEEEQLLTEELLEAIDNDRRDFEREIMQKHDIFWESFDGKMLQGVVFGHKPLYKGIELELSLLEAITHPNELIRNEVKKIKELK